MTDSSLQYDRRRKLPRYAAAGIQETWLVNLPGEAVEMYSHPHEGESRDVQAARRGETIAALAFPDLPLRVGEILG